MEEGYVPGLANTETNLHLSLDRQVLVHQRQLIILRKEYMSIPSLYTPAEVADYLHVSRGTIYSILSRGEISSLKIGRNRRFTAEQVREYIKKRGDVLVTEIK